MARYLFMLTVTACSGPATPAAPPAVPQTEPPRAIWITPDAAIPPIAGTPCDRDPACGPTLTCDRSLPGGYCSASCGPPGSACGGGTCVELADRNACAASCQTDDDCRATEGYACDPVWHGCMLPNTATIAPATCKAPIGIGRDPAFAPATALAEASPGHPAAVVTDQGGLVVLHETHTEANGLAMVRLDVFGRVAPAAAFPGHGVAPALARDGTTIYAVWADHAGQSRILLARSPDRGQTWERPIAVDDPVDCADHADHCVDAPAIAVGRDPQQPSATTVYVAYAAGGGWRLRSSHDRGATFGHAITVLDGIRGDLAVDARGVIYAIALHGSRGAAYGSGDHRIDLAVSTTGGRTFSRPRTLSRFGEKLPFYGATPRIVVDSSRRWIYAAYVRGGRDAKWDLQLVATRDLQRWTHARIADDPACATHFDPALAIDPSTGTLHVAWYDSRGMRFAHAVCTGGLARCRQLGRINDLPFAGLSLARHGETAVGDAQALAIDATHRALHAVWTQAVDVDGTPTARLFHAKGRLPGR